MYFQRSGECNRCGECCGSELGPMPHSPWPLNWPWAKRHLTYDNFVDIFKYAPLVGISEGPDGLIRWVDHGSRLLPGQGTFYYKWAQGTGFCKDTSAAHDGSSWNHECPFLLDDDGTDPTGEGIPHRLCAIKLMPQFAQEWETECGQYPQEYFPDERFVTEWFTRHPSCSYIYTADPDYTP